MGKSTGPPIFDGKNHGFPVDFPLNDGSMVGFDGFIMGVWGEAFAAESPERMIPVRSRETGHGNILQLHTSPSREFQHISPPKPEAPGGSRGFFDMCAATPKGSQCDLSGCGKVSVARQWRPRREHEQKGIDRQTERYE